MKKDDELEQIKKNIKSTKWIEFETEVNQYRDESLRLRKLIEDLMKEGPNHPIYQQ